MRLEKLGAQQQRFSERMNPPIFETQPWVSGPPLNRRRVRSFPGRRWITNHQISLIRVHTETIKPPRALWVPIDLGRPLGTPNDSAFQKRVLVSALRQFKVGISGHNN